MSGPQLSMNIFAVSNNVGATLGAKTGLKSSSFGSRNQTKDSTNTNNNKNRASSGNVSSNRHNSKQNNQNNQNKSQEKPGKNSRRTDQPRTNDSNKKQPGRGGGGARNTKGQSTQNSSNRRHTKNLNKNESDSAFALSSDMMNTDGDNFMKDDFPPVRNISKQGPEPLQAYDQNEIKTTGPVFPNPGSFGFMKRQHSPTPRPYPKYMLVQPRLLKAPPFHQNEWDRQNQEKMLQMEEANNGSDFQGLYEDFQKMREVERAKMEELGLVDAENTRKDLNDAIFFQGTCLDMCPTFERVRRALENNVKALEKDFASQKISRARAVKAFSRPAAGQPPPMPSDVRPPHVLHSTLDYLVGTILPQLPDSHSFLWDRTRSIRQDFVYQNYYGPEAIDCNERIVRVHLLCMHVMAKGDVEYSQQQELEQFNKALQTLIEIYQDVRNHGGSCPNEAEFRAYHLISHFRDPELEREIQKLPDTIFKDARVQLALRFRLLMSQNITERGHVNKIGSANMFVKFFELAFHENTPFLMACLLETHFNEIRFYALKSLSRSYHTGGKALIGSSLSQMLGFDSPEDLVDFVTYYEVDVIYDQGVLLIDLCNKEKLENVYKLKSIKDKPKRSPAFSLILDARLAGNSIKSLVNAGLPNVDLHLREESSNTVLPGVFVRKPPKISNTLSEVSSRSDLSLSANTQNTFGTAPSTASAVFPANAITTTNFGSGGGFGSVGGFNSGSGFGPGSGFGANPGSGPSGIGSLNLANFVNATNSAPQLSLFGQASATQNQNQFGQSQSGQSRFEHSQGSFSQLPQKSLQSVPQNTVTFPNKNSSENSSNSFSFTRPEAQKSAAPDFLSQPQQMEPQTQKLPAPAFSFNAQNKILQNEKIKEKKSLEPQKSSNTFSFDTAAANFKTQADAKEQIPLFSVPTTSAISKVPQATVSSPQIETAAYPHVHFASSPQVKEIERIPAAAPKAPSIKDSPKYEDAVKNVLNELVNDVVTTQLTSVVQKANAAENRALERQKVIDLFSQELFLAFVSEVTYQTALESTADNFHNTHLLKRVIGVIDVKCKLALKKKRINESRMKELEDVNFKAPSIKRVSSLSTSDSVAKRKKTLRSDTSYQDISRRQSEIRNLWDPVDLHKFVDTCSEKYNNEANHSVAHLKCMLVVENWALDYSKWLASKLSLNLSDDKSYYYNKVENSQLTLEIESLTKNTLSSAKAVENVAFLVFECGLTDSETLNKYKDLATKLNRDRGILDRILKFCNYYCNLKVEVMIIVWDVSHSKTPKEQIDLFFNFERYKNSCVESLHLCDMTVDNGNVDLLLQSSLTHLADSFSGHLTTQGKRKAEVTELKLKTKFIKPEEISEVNTNLHVKEQQLLEKAKVTQLHSYLTKHMGRRNTADLTNVSGVFKTPNASFANRSAIYNKSILGNHSFNSFGKDNSFFKSIIEESTPFASPKPDPHAILKVPKKVLDLRKLTASIKEKYRK